MTKQDLIAQINQNTASQSIKDTLLARVNLYPEELQDQHLNDFEELVRATAIQEDLAAVALSKAANHMQAGLDKEEVDFVTQMNDLAQEAEATNKQMASLAG